MAESLEDRLNKAAGGGAGLSAFDGQTVTVTKIVKEKSRYPEQEFFVKATIVDSELNETVIAVTPTAGRQLVEIEDVLPVDLVVVSFPSSYGKTGYKFELASS